ncbi:hypothetical protein BDQ17DRAFT_1430121 [Cyathus striatus]|nr:hypothetical protein BDQ17DRAFT_1430121 [Cyathus striatus]
MFNQVIENAPSQQGANPNANTFRDSSSVFITLQPNDVQSSPESADSSSSDLPDFPFGEWLVSEALLEGESRNADTPSVSSHPPAIDQPLEHCEVMPNFSVHESGSPDSNTNDTTTHTSAGQRSNNTSNGTTSGSVTNPGLSIMDQRNDPQQHLPVVDTTTHIINNTYHQVQTRYTYPLSKTLMINHKIPHRNHHYHSQPLPPAINYPLNEMSRPNQNTYGQQFVQGSGNTSSHRENAGNSATSSYHASIMTTAPNRRYHPYWMPQRLPRTSNPLLNQMNKPNQTLHGPEFVQGSSRDSLPINYHPNKHHRLPVLSFNTDLPNVPHTGEMTEETGGTEGKSASSNSHTVKHLQTNTITEAGDDAALLHQTLKDDGTPKRPMNAFLIFARRRRAQIVAMHNNNTLTVGETSKIVAKEWKEMPKVEKDTYENKYKKLRDEFERRNPDYVYKRGPNGCRKKRKPDGNA